MTDRMTEKQFMGQVVELAKLKGWLVYHTYDSRRSEPGFPDLCMVRNGRAYFAELKTEKGKVTDPQRDWIEAIDEVSTASTGFVEMWIWRPSDWDEIVEVLS